MVRLLRCLPALCLGCLTACASAPWQAKEAGRPLTPRERATYPLTVAPPGAHRALSDADAASRADLVPLAREALAAQGFRVVDHSPFRGDLEANLRLEHEADGATRVLLELTSDDFLVDQAWTVAPAAVLADAAQARALVQELCARLGRSEGLADFVRNSGTPQQQMFTE